MSNPREQLHELVDRVPESRLVEAVSSLSALLEHEQITGDEERDVAAARKWLAENPESAIPNSEVLAEFGLTEDDFWRLGQQHAEQRRR